jgi:hypothetical protein
MRSIGRLIIVFLLPAMIGLGGCGTFFIPRQHKAEYLAGQAHWAYHPVNASPFVLAGYIGPRRQDGGVLTVFIEGDGLAFIGSQTVSSDPTPTDPVGLRLALAHPGGNVAYLGRPCQYVSAPACRPAYWSSHRYAPEVIGAFNLAVDELKGVTGAERVILVGYSGGGAVAVLTAARRNDVVGIVTVASNLDLRFWTARDGLVPLWGSLDPADVATAVAGIPQVHFVGGQDDVVGPAVAQSYLRRMGDVTRAAMVEEKSYNHNCCWADNWPILVRHPALSAVAGWAGSAIKESGK